MPCQVLPFLPDISWTHKILMKLSGLPEERLAILGGCGGAIALAELVDLSREN